MESAFFPLGISQDNRFIRILRILFGLACIAMGIYWIIYNLRSARTDWSLWVTIIFLFAFGFYQIWAGSGRAMRYIGISREKINLKKDSLRSPVIILPEGLEKIDFYPLSIIFFHKGGRKILLRLGTIHYETNEKIIDALITFAEVNNIRYEVRTEEI